MALNLDDHLTLAVTHRPGLQADLSLFGLDSRHKPAGRPVPGVLQPAQLPHGELTLLPGTGGETQRFTLQLDRLPKHVARLMLVLTAEEALDPTAGSLRRCWDGPCPRARWCPGRQLAQQRPR